MHAPKCSKNRRWRHHFISDFSWAGDLNWPHLTSGRSFFITGCHQGVAWFAPKIMKKRDFKSPSSGKMEPGSNYVGKYTFFLLKFCLIWDWKFGNQTYRKRSVFFSLQPTHKFSAFLSEFLQPTDKICLFFYLIFCNLRINFYIFFQNIFPGKLLLENFFLENKSIKNIKFILAQGWKMRIENFKPKSLIFWFWVPFNRARAI